VFIDHPDGVTLALCERVTRELNDLRERYALEVSSPGSRRPLTKPAHYLRFVGRRACVRTRRPISDRSHAPSHSSGERGTLASVKSFTGELVGATDSEVTLAADGGVIAIPYSDISRSHLLED
jgi:ribosome maturation factor RimP